MKVDGIFSGGGIKAIAITGALEVAEQQGITFARAAGTSAGAIIASLTMAGYTSKEMQNILLSLKFQKLLDTNRFWIPGAGVFYKWVTLYVKMGLYRGNKFERWMHSLLKEKGVEAFADLPDGSLKVVVSDLTSGRLIVLPDQLPEYGINPRTFSVARAVRMSSSLPYFFEPIKLTDKQNQKHIIVDGGVLSNFPIWLFSEEEPVQKRPILGFKLSAMQENIPPHQIENALQLFHALFETMKDAHDARYIEDKHAKKIIFIPVDHVSTVDFSLSMEKKQALIELGRERAIYFLKRWSY